MLEIGKKLFFGASKRPHTIIDFRSHGNSSNTGVATLLGPTGKITKAVKSPEGRYRKL